MYLDHLYGLKAGNAYVQGIRKNIKNDKPIIGTYGVNQRGSDDMYYKGANMLHTIRYVIGNEGTWRLLLRGLNHKFYHQTVTTKEIENYISEFTKIDFSTVFDQYLRTTQIPTLEYKVGKKFIKVRWSNCVPDLHLPVRIYINNIQYVIKPTSKWEKTKFNVKIETFDVDQNYYINTKEVD
ncbi:MAG: M1 family peptidase, partial [Flavicella sp.]|nr:M1 family peptidase [Flavicella sp.]